MTAHQIPASTPRRPAPTQARGLAVASGPRPKAVFTLLVLVVLLMAGPALVAGISLFDPHVLDARR